MARGNDPINDPKWDGLDSLSLPNRPAHPDPARRFEATDDPDSAPTHGVYGHVEAKHGIPSEAEVRANDAALAQASRDSLEGEIAALRGAADGGDEDAAVRLKHAEHSLKSLPKADDVDFDGATAGDRVRAELERGELQVDLPTHTNTAGYVATANATRGEEPTEAGIVGEGVQGDQGGSTAAATAAGRATRGGSGSSRRSDAEGGDDK